MHYVYRRPPSYDERRDSRRSGRSSMSGCHLDRGAGCNTLRKLCELWPIGCLWLVLRAGRPDGIRLLSDQRHPPVVLDLPRFAERDALDPIDHLLVHRPDVIRTGDGGRSHARARPWPRDWPKPRGPEPEFACPPPKSRPCSA